jgi:hypothetical protein
MQLAQFIPQGHKFRLSRQAARLSYIIPVHDDGSSQETCNRFLRSVKVVELDRQFTTCEGYGCGTACRSDGRN